MAKKTDKEKEEQPSNPLLKQLLNGQGYASLEDAMKVVLEKIKKHEEKKQEGADGETD